MKIRKLFELERNLTSYKIPVLKVAGCVLVDALTFFRREIFAVQSRLFSAIITIILGQLIILCLPVLYISVAEIVIIYRKQRKTKQKACSCKARRQCTPEEILAWVQSNDIIDIELCVNAKSIHIGASSDCNSAAGKMYDKRYYIGKREIVDIDAFQTEVCQFCVNGMLSVHAIDGVHPKYYK